MDPNPENPVGITPSEQASMAAEKRGLSQIAEAANRVWKTAKESGMPLFSALPLSLASELQVQQQSASKIEIPSDVKKIIGDVKDIVFPNRVGMRTAIGAIGGAAALGAIHLLSAKDAPKFGHIALYAVAGAAIGNHLENV